MKYRVEICDDHAKRWYNRTWRNSLSNAGSVSAPLEGRWIVIDVNDLDIDDGVAGDCGWLPIRQQNDCLLSHIKAVLYQIILMNLL